LGIFFELNLMVSFDTTCSINLLTYSLSLGNPGPISFSLGGLFALNVFVELENALGFVDNLYPENWK